MDDLQSYLDQICSQLGFDSAEVRLELKHHIEQAAAKLEAAGHQPDEALRLAITEFGDPVEIAARLAQAHKQGGAAMYRRVIAPALLAIGVWFGVTVLNSLGTLLDRRIMDSVLAREAGSWMMPVMPPLQWLLLPAVFVAIYLCASRGGTRRECILVALSPLILGGLVQILILFSAAGLSLFSIAIGVRAVLSGDTSLGTFVMTRQSLRDLLSLGGSCLAATWLYFFAARRMRERPFWLAAEQQSPEGQPSGG